MFRLHRNAFSRRPWRSVRLLLWLAAGVALGSLPAPAVILWSDLGATLVHETGVGSDILGGAVKRDGSATNTLYFKFHVDPLSDVSTESYFAAFQLFEDDEERLGVGNSQGAWGYSAFKTSDTGNGNQVFGDVDLRSSRPESSAPGVFQVYEIPRRGIEVTFVFKVQYVSGEDALITVWLNPDLAPGATEESQPESLATRFRANAAFNQIRLRHGGGGGGWTFSDMAIATSFSDFVSGAASGDPNGLRPAALSLAFRAWQREQGLPQNSVHALAQTRDGYLWIGCDDGIARFDGVRFVSFGLREGLRSGPVCKLLQDSRGTLWIGTVAGGLSRCHNGRFDSFTTQDGLPSDTVTALAEDAEGRLWVGTRAGVVIFQDGRLTRLPSASNFNAKTITALFRDAKGLMWIGATGAGVYQFRDGQFFAVNHPSVDSLLLNPHCLLVDRAGRLWIGAGDDFVLCREGDQWRRYRIPRHLAKPFVNNLAEQPDGTVWAGSVSEGLLQFRGGKLALITAGGGLSDNLIESLLVDREGNLWVGTSAGLNRLCASSLLVLGQNDGLGYGAVHGLAEVAPGVIWAAKPNDSLYRWDGRRFNSLVAADSSRYSEINALLVTRDGSCWAASPQGLLRFQNPAGEVPEPDSPMLSGCSVVALTEDRDEGLWVGTREGQLWRRRGGTWSVETNYSQPHPVTALVQDSDRSLWVGTEGGGLTRYRQAPQAPADKVPGLLSSVVRSLHLDSQGTLWIGTAGGGLSRWRDSHLVTFTTRDGLVDNTVSQILEDSGCLWLGTGRGIACVKKAELEQLAAGQLPAVYPQVFGRVEGMLSEECTGGFSPAGLKTRSGWLWFPTLKGIVAANPRSQVTAAAPPTVVLEETLVDGTVVCSVDPKPSDRQRPPVYDLDAPAVQTSNVITIPPGKHRVEFRYAGLSFSAPERVRFRYRLENLDPDWVEAGTRRVAFYAYIPPGQYRFQVIACNSAGGWSQPGASLTLTVGRNFYETWWFIALAGFGLVVSVGGAGRIVEKRKHQRHLHLLEQERALERERTRISQDLHDDLGSSLTRISLLSNLVKADKDVPAQVEAHANKIAQSADLTVRALEEIVWALRPASDSLQSLVEYIAHFANELFEGDSARCRLDLPHDLPPHVLPPDVRHNIFLIVKEALTNALKHAGAHEVHVQAKASAQSLEFLVQDDGCGFDLQAPPCPGKRHGLGNMRARAEAMGGSLTVHSTPTGTTVHLILPGFPIV